MMTKHNIFYLIALYLGFYLWSSTRTKENFVFKIKNFCPNVLRYKPFNDF